MLKKWLDVTEMVEYKIKVNREQRLAYIPKEIFEALGTELTAVPNRAAVLLYPEKVPLKTLSKALH